VTPPVRELRQLLYLWTVAEEFTDDERCCRMNLSDACYSNLADILDAAEALAESLSISDVCGPRPGIGRLRDESKAALARWHELTAEVAS